MSAKDVALRCRYEQPAASTDHAANTQAVRGQRAYVTLPRGVDAQQHVSMNGSAHRWCAGKASGQHRSHAR